MKNLRLIITLKCNFNCSYCCNELEAVNSRFLKKQLNEIDFDSYDNVSITGGEPTLFPELFDKILQRVKGKKYLYTNGTFLTKEIISKFDGVNIGIHYRWQLSLDLLDEPNVTLHINELKKSWVGTRKNVKLWRMNACEVKNEDWILLTN